MKKILLSTIALVTIASQALAGDFNVIFGGKSEFTPGLRKSSAYNKIANPSSNSNWKSTFTGNSVFVVGSK